MVDDEFEEEEEEPSEPDDIEAALPGPGSYLAAAPQ